MKVKTWNICLKDKQIIFINGTHAHVDFSGSLLIYNDEEDYRSPIHIFASGVWEEIRCEGPQEKK